MSLQAAITWEAQRAKLGRIFHRAMRARGIAVSADTRLIGGHWHVRRDQTWVRVTDALNFEVVK